MTVTNENSGTRIDEIADGIHRISLRSSLAMTSRQDLRSISI